MKKQYGFIGLITISLLGAAIAHADTPPVQESPEFWNKVNTLVAQCTVKPYALVQGVKTYGSLRSTCRELQVSGDQASFILDGEQFSARIEESADSDGGDLDNIYVQNSNGAVIAQRHNVLAYNDILLGLAGGNVDSKEVLSN
jgi:hypothetical protein